DPAIACVTVFSSPTTTGAAVSAGRGRRACSLCLTSTSSRVCVRRVLRVEACVVGFGEMQQPSDGSDRHDVTATVVQHRYRELACAGQFVRLGAADPEQGSSSDEIGVHTQRVYLLESPAMP